MRPRALPIVLVALVLSLGGCIFSRDMARLQREIERDNPELRLRRSFVLNLGSGSIHTLESLVRLVDRDDAQLAARYLQDVDRVRIGIYDVEWREEAQPLNVTSVGRFVDEGWEQAVAVREDNETTYLLYKPNPRTIRDLYVVTLSDDQLIAVRLQGNMQRILVHALQDRHQFTGSGFSAGELESLGDG